jgi:hypothetical protein
MRKIKYAGYWFPPEIIRQAIWLYLRFTLSLRVQPAAETWSMKSRMCRSISSPGKP